MKIQRPKIKQNTQDLGPLIFSACKWRYDAIKKSPIPFLPKDPHDNHWRKGDNLSTGLAHPDAIQANDLSAIKPLTAEDRRAKINSIIIADDKRLFLCRTTPDFGTSLTIFSTRFFCFLVYLRPILTVSIWVCLEKFGNP